MKKTLIAILLVLAVSMVSVFALDGFTFYSGIGYDIRKVADLENSSRSMELDLGTKYAVGEGFNVYFDLGVRFVGSGVVGGTKFDKNIFGTNIHAGILYGMRFVNAPEVEAYIGGGLSYANTSFHEKTHDVIFNNLGVGLKCMVAYRVNEKFAVALSEHSDVYFLNSSNITVGYGNSISAGALYKL